MADEGTTCYYGHYSDNKIHHTEEKIPSSVKWMAVAIIVLCIIFLLQ